MWRKVVAHYNFVVPDICHDMHASCGGGDPIQEGDTWLSANVPTIMGSAAYRAGAVVYHLGMKGWFRENLRRSHGVARAVAIYQAWLHELDSLQSWGHVAHPGGSLLNNPTTSH